MFKLLKEDFTAELLKLKLYLMLLFAYVRIHLAILQANARRKRHLALERIKYGKKAYDMNFNVAIIALRDKKGRRKDTFMIASDNEIVDLVHLMWLPKRMTAPKMDSRKSIFYKTTPKMSRKQSVNQYLNYVKAEFEVSNYSKMTENSAKNAVAV